MTRNLRVDGERILARLKELAALGDTGDGGSCRLALTDSEKAGRDLLCRWITDAGLTLRVDRVGNIVGLLPGREDGPAVIMGSHIDTVATGGVYDGALGVVAGLEVLTRLREEGVVPRRPMAVIAFTNEEGARFQPDMFGSCVWAGVMSLDEAYAARDPDGLTAGAELRRIGYVGDMEPGSLPAHAYLELHIEQGPVLHADGGGIGAVTGVQAITWLEITIDGVANHAGTTPMSYRRDAGLLAARLTVFAHDLARRIEGQVANVGCIAFEPNNINVVPRRATLTLDIRNPSDERLAEAEAWVRGFLERWAEEAGLTVGVRDLARFPAVAFDPGLVAQVERTAQALGHRVRRMHSGAGHDAQMMAGIAPTAMIFVPSVDGISHNPNEYTSLEDLTGGADVLMSVACEVAEA